MAKQQAPWSVRGVSPEARAKAAKAAARRRMTIGEWVTNALITVANEELGAGRPQAQATPGNGALAAGGGEALVEVVEGLTQRLEESSEQSRAVCRLAERLDGLARAGETLATIAARFRALDARDRALLALAERLVANERRTEQRLASLASAMEALARRQGQPLGEEALRRALAPLEERIGGLAARLEGATLAASARPELRAVEPERSAAAEPLGALPDLDYEALNERAIDNTRRLEDEDGERTRSGVIARLFRGA